MFKVKMTVVDVQRNVLLGGTTLRLLYFFRFECVNLISELSIYMYAHVERNQKVCAS